MHGQDLSDVWTPKLVEERLVEAVRWAVHNVGPTGPSGIRVLTPTYLPTIEERIENDWLDPPADDDEDKPLRPMLSPEKVTQLEAALYWPAKYAVPGLPGSARILNLWLRCKVYRMNFGDAVSRRTEISRASAYRMRDRAVAAIAQGLTRDKVPV